MKKLIAIAGLTLIGLPSSGQDYEAGEKLFKMNCASCHKMDAKLVGPPLQNVVSEQGVDWTKKWILNNEALRQSGDTHANAIYAEYNNMVMPTYSSLRDEEISGLVDYLENWGTKQAEIEQAVADTPNVAGGEAMVKQNGLSFASKFILFIVTAAVLIIFMTMYTILQAFKVIVELKIKDSK